MAKRTSYAKQLEQAERARKREAELRAKEEARLAALATQEAVDSANQELTATLTTLETLLQSGINRRIKFEHVVDILSRDFHLIPPRPEKHGPPPDKAHYSIPKATFIENLTGIGKDKRLKRTSEIEARYKAATEAYDKQVQDYQDQVQKRKDAIREFRQRLSDGEGEAMGYYLAALLAVSEYPATFPHIGKVAFKAVTGELIIESELPRYEDIIPSVKGYKYVKAHNTMEPLPLNKTDERNMQALYGDVVASIALRTLNEVMYAELTDKVQSVIFNGMVRGVDKATGKDVRPCLVSVQTTRDEFCQLDLSRVDKKQCLKYLKARTSPSYQELLPVKPVVELNMTDPRFIDEVDIISGLDSRPNLLEMNPFEFEHLISNLFTKMGLKTSTTRASRDGGVDVVAFDERPIFGGKIIIQAKRYRNTVEVSAVRDLYGAVQKEGATKGILVTTSSFGSESRKFAKDIPLDLIDGNQLLYLLQEHGIEAKIEIPKQ